MLTVGVIVVMIVILLTYLACVCVDSHVSGVWVAETDFLANAHLEEMYLYIGKSSGVLSQTHPIHLVMVGDDGEFVENRSGTLSYMLGPLILTKQMFVHPIDTEIRATLLLDYNPEDNAYPTQAIPENIHISFNCNATHMEIVCSSDEDKYEIKKRYASLWKDTQLTHVAHIKAMQYN